MAKYTARKQKQDESKHRENILVALQESPKTFKELDGSMPFTHTTLSKHLRYLREKSLISKIIHKDNQAYTLTEKGESAYNEIFMLQKFLTEIKERGGKYLSGGVPTQPGLSSQSSDYEPLFWPSTVHVAVDKNIEDVFQLISKEYLFLIQDNLIRHMLGNIKNKKLNLHDDKSGTIILGLSINYDEIVSMVKNNSYANWEKLWKKEKAINTIWVQDSITPHNKPYVLPYHIGEKKK